MTHRKRRFWGDVPAYCNVPMYECILHCLPAAAGECACQVHAADICICCRKGWQDGDAAFYHDSLITFIIIIIICQFLYYVCLLRLSLAAFQTIFLGGSCSRVPSVLPPAAAAGL